MNQNFNPKCFDSFIYVYRKKFRQNINDFNKKNLNKIFV